jgi:hypothetical protein
MATASSACRLGEHHAAPPADGPSGGADAPPPTGGDGPPAFHGMHVTIGDRPEVSGTCKTLPDYTTMMSKFAAPKQEEDAAAGWDFETDADDYSDPSYGFDPAWPMAAAKERFSARYRATIQLAAGAHCFSIDVGATGTDLFKGKNMCGQIYVGVAGAAPTKLAETGFEAATSGVATGCVDVPRVTDADGAAASVAPSAAGGAELDIVFWYFDVVFQKAVLHVRHCAGAACTPDQPLSVPDLAPL